MPMPPSTSHTWLEDRLNSFWASRGRVMGFSVECSFACILYTSRPAGSGEEGVFQPGGGGGAVGRPDQHLARPHVDAADPLPRLDHHPLGDRVDAPAVKVDDARR